MKILKMVLAAACAVASTSATATVLETQANPGNSQVSTCYYIGQVIIGDTIYDAYECYSNGDGTY